MQCCYREVLTMDTFTLKLPVTDLDHVLSQSNVLYAKHLFVNVLLFE